MQEQRKHVRFQVPIMVEFPNPSTMKTERSFSSDVSETGLRFPTPVRFEVGHELPLTLQLPYQDQPFHATGEVMWVRQIARLGSTHQYEIGLRFRWIEDPDRQRLGRFFQHVRSSKI